ncbi:MAG: histidine phosphatase family protein [Puniceicoccales bacterium]|jgi:phosphohistidine phosphatase SixA|nr:histidine phosphatase family protein [Puniceicoccales bacterium]
MRIFLLRHARAHLPRSAGDDAQCDLTTAGRAQVTELVSRLNLADFAGVKVIEHSPYRRAAETARLFAAAAGLATPLRENTSITPDGDPEAVAAGLLHSTGDRLLVGHNPLYETLANVLLCGRPFSLMTNFLPGSLMEFEFISGPSNSHPLGYWRLAGFTVPAQPPLLAP